MEALLKEISTLSGVVGAFIYSRKYGIISRSLLSIFKDQNLIKLGNQLQRAFVISEKSKLGLDFFEISYEGARLLCKPFGRNAGLFLICEPDVNMALLNMSINVISDDLAEKIAAVKTQPKAASASEEKVKSTDPGTRTQETQKPDKPSVKPKQLMQSNEMGPVLHEIQDAFIDVIGPMGKIIMKRWMKVWIKQGQADMPGIPALIQMLSEQLDDAQGKAKFMENLTHLLANS